MPLEGRDSISSRQQEKPWKSAPSIFPVGRTRSEGTEQGSSMGAGEEHSAPILC
jgi:hypothetical protein